MKPITPNAHGYLDYLTVVVFLSAPKLLGLDGLPALLSWTLAGGIWLKENISDGLDKT